MGTAIIIIFPICTIIAIIVAPFAGIWASEKLNERKEIRNRKMDIFRDLMATRATALSPKHVEALNRIDIEFYSVDEVSEAWNEYRDHLYQAINLRVDDKEGWANWTSKKDDLLINLLSKMATSLGYKFGNVHIKRGHYHPQAYADIETELMIIRRGIVEILMNKRGLPIMSFTSPETQQQT